MGDFFYEISPEISILRYNSRKRTLEGILMSPAQIILLKSLIALDRRYWLRKEAGELVHRNDRGIEVGWECRVNTARALCDAGLAEMIDPGINGNAYIFLGNYNTEEHIDL